MNLKKSVSELDSQAFYCHQDFIRFSWFKISLVVPKRQLNLIPDIL